LAMNQRHIGQECYVEGYLRWNWMGRSIRSGEKGIMILARMAVWKRSAFATKSASESIKWS